MAQDTIPQADPKETVSYSLPAEVVRAIEYRAFLDRSNKSEAAARLIQAGATTLGQRTPTDPQEAA